MQTSIQSRNKFSKNKWKSKSKPNTATDAMCQLECCSHVETEDCWKLDDTFTQRTFTIRVQAWQQKRHGEAEKVSPESKGKGNGSLQTVIKERRDET